MATSYLTLGQLNPSATTATTLYTCPASTQTVVSSIVICNQAAVAATYRVAIRKSGASLTAQHYIVYDASIAANTTTSYTLGVTLGATDIITVYASTATMSFSAFGSEIA
jgi:glucose-6-phosphate dehydrogenase assembly protein OpcA